MRQNERRSLIWHTSRRHCATWSGAAVAAAACLAFLAPAAVDAGDQRVHRFERQRLSAEFTSEGATFGDLSGDGVADIVSGPYWYEGPAFERRHEIYEPRVFDPKGYSDNFFAFLRDFNRDGRNDLLVIGFPGKDASWFENPGDETRHWTRHQVFAAVDNESPTFADLTGDGVPELVCQSGGRFGYATPDEERPTEPWRFVAISGDRKVGRFNHGLGIGDVNGDGRLDVLERTGWYEQPASLETEPLWTHHPFAFDPEEAEKHGVPGRGGAQMFAEDIDGDGDADIVTSLDAHGWGLYWYEQASREGQTVFVPHRIMGSPADRDPHDVRISQLHAIDLVDMDGDGLRDIVTGKRVWAHYNEADAGPPGLIYWFRLVRTRDSVAWEPRFIDDGSGVGTQVVTGDVDGDGLVDVVVGNKTGTFFLRHGTERTSGEESPRKDSTVFHTEGQTPLEAAKSMTVPEGFRVTLAAGEPDVHQPVAFALDERGRVWVAEGHTYPRRVGGAQGLWNEGRDRILVLEDRDGDGTLESRKVFIEGLNLVSGIEVGFGGVWIGAAPYLLFFPDRDRDDRPDGEPEILLDGFGFQDTHETLNSFIWGPDGWLYGCHGVFTHSRVGKPGTPDAERVPLNAGFWRYHPTRREFEVFAWGTSNPWGIDFNDRGQAFATACVIPHLYHVIQGARYQRQAGRHFNPHVYDDLKTIADHRHYAGDIRDHAWWGQEPTVPGDTLAAGGGHAHCGAMFYLGDEFPPQYRDRLFMNNIHGNRVNVDVPERSGSGYFGRHGKDFMLANDKWFRGLDLQTGPDGGVYVSDWYDRNACHRTLPEIWDRSNGRIYKVTYGEPRRVEVALHEAPSSELVELQLHPNDFFVRAARRILQERGPDPKVHADLVARLDASNDVTRKLRLLWALHVTGGVDERLGLAQLSSEHEYVRAWTIQLLAEDRAVSAGILGMLESMARRDPSPVVRLYLASALQRLPLGSRWRIVEGLVAHSEDASDHNLPLMVWYGIEPLVVADTSRAMTLARSSQIPLLARYITRRAASEPDRLEAVVAALLRTEDREARELIVEEMSQALAGQARVPMPPSWSRAFEILVREGDDTLRQRAEAIAVKFGDRRIFPRLRQVLANDDLAVERRRHALGVLLDGRDREAVPILQELVRDRALRPDVLRALAAFDDPDTARAILGSYREFSAAERSDALSTLASRPAWARALLGAVRDGEVARTELSAFTIRQLDELKDPEIQGEIEEVWGKVRRTSAEKLAEIERYRRELSPERLRSADVSNGRAVFARTCQSCHKLFGEGESVAPDLTGSNRADLDYLLENLLDPGAVVGKDYQLSVFITRTGRTVSGLITGETKTAITVRTVNDTVVIPRADILTRSLSDSSMMPEGQLDELSRDEVRDLVAYLGSPTQVLMRGSPAGFDPVTRRQPGALEGEGLVVLARGGGNTAPQDMRNFPAGAWSGDSQLWWTGARPGDRLELALPVSESGRYHVQVALTRARDYGVVQLYLDGEPVEAPVDLYHPEVVSTGHLSLGTHDLSRGEHRLGVAILGDNPEAVPSHMFGLDYVLLEREDAEATASANGVPTGGGE